MRVILSLLTLGLVVACSPQGNTAKIVYKGDQFFGIDGQQPVADIAGKWLAWRYGQFADTNKQHGKENVAEWKYIDKTPHSDSSTVSLANNSVAVTESNKHKNIVYVRDLEPVQVSEPRMNADRTNNTSSDAEIVSAIPRKSYIPRNLFAAGDDRKTVHSSTETASRSNANSGNIVLAEHAVSHSIKQGFIWPVHGTIISSFGEKPNGERNDGINIAANAGSPVRAVSDGVVVYAGNELEGYGNMVIIRHDNGWMSAYAHADSLRVDVDDRVQQGDVIATVGSTGDVNVAQLHFGLRDGKQAVDPLLYLEQNYATIQ